MTNEQSKRSLGQYAVQPIKKNQTWERIDNRNWIRIKEVYYDQRVLAYDAHSDNVLFSPEQIRNEFNLTVDVNEDGLADTSIKVDHREDDIADLCDAGEENPYTLCTRCQGSFHEDDLTEGKCSECNAIERALKRNQEIVESDQKFVASLTPAEADEYSQCIACEQVIDNEFISEYGLCIECLRNELRALLEK